MSASDQLRQGQGKDVHSQIAEKRLGQRSSRCRRSGKGLSPTDIEALSQKNAEERALHCVEIVIDVVRVHDSLLLRLRVL
eukprot:1326132-Amphidinium_carterae.1